MTGLFWIGFACGFIIAVFVCAIMFPITYRWFMGKVANPSGEHYIETPEEKRLREQDTGIERIERMKRDRGE